MFNFIFYGRFSSWDFYGSSTGVQHIDLTDDGIIKNILPVIKERGYTQVVSMDDIYGGDFTDKFLKAKTKNGIQICEIKEEHPDDGYALTYYVFVQSMEYDEEFNEQDFNFDIYAFQDFHNTDNTDDMPV